MSSREPTPPVRRAKSRRPIPLTHLNAHGGYPKAARILRRSEYLRVQGKGMRVHTDAFVVVVLRSPNVGIRLGLSVSKRVGNAVVRNRIRRTIKEAFRRYPFPCLDLGLDLVVIAKPDARLLAKGGFAGIRDQLGYAFSRAIRKAALEEDIS